MTPDSVKANRVLGFPEEEERLSAEAEKKLKHATSAKTVKALKKRNNRTPEVPTDDNNATGTSGNDGTEAPPKDIGENAVTPA